METRAVLRAGQCVLECKGVRHDRDQPVAQPGSVTPLRVAVLAPVSWRVPPRHYGPWEQFASLLTEGLVARGVEVTLFATADSVTAARLASVVPRGYSEDPDVEPKVAECLHIAHAFERAAEFDVIHNSFDFLPLTYSGLVDTPVLTTIHGFSSPRILPVYQRYNATTAYVAISDADRHPSARLRRDDPPRDRHGCVRTASDARRLPALLRPDPSRQGNGRRRSRWPGAAVCRCVIAGIVQDQAYFDEQVAPRDRRRRVRFIGPVGPAERSALLGGAHALLHLIGFEEPFGYSVVEAMACGTPGDRVPTRIDAGADRPTARRASWSTRSTGPSPPSAGGRLSTGP